MNKIFSFTNNVSSKEESFFDNDIKLNYALLKNKIENKSVLVIGGAGTIGLNYIKQILKFKPSKIVVVDTNENGLTELTRDLRSSKLLDYNPIYITYPVNLLSKIFDKIFFKFHYNIIANFSAHKHVRSEKDKISIEALINNNVFGAIKLLKLCEKQPPNYFFSVSTDKATNPVNVMGASKSLMEKLILSMKNNFRVSTARFANVSFSNGSLLDGYLHRINKNQCLSCPNDIRRFFVTPKQSGKICLLSTFLNESGSVFFPKFNFDSDQKYFKDITIDFLKFIGYTPFLSKNENDAKNFDFKNNNKLYPVYFFRSNTSGEKKYEEFYSENENVVLDQHESIGFIKTKDVKISFKDVKDSFDKVFMNDKSRKIDIINVIKKFVNDFDHIETGKLLDEKM